MTRAAIVGAVAIIAIAVAVMVLRAGSPLELYDANGDGVIDADELLTAYRDYADGLIDDETVDLVARLYYEGRRVPRYVGVRPAICDQYDANDDDVIDRAEVVAAIADRFDNVITKAQALVVIDCYYTENTGIATPTSTPTSTATATPTPTPVPVPPGVDVCVAYDLNGNGQIDRGEVVLAISDYFDDHITREQVTRVIECYHVAIGSTPTPTSIPTPPTATATTTPRPPTPTPTPETPPSCPSGGQERAAKCVPPPVLPIPTPGPTPSKLAAPGHLLAREAQRGECDLCRYGHVYLDWTDVHGADYYEVWEKVERSFPFTDTWNRLPASRLKFKGSRATVSHLKVEETHTFRVRGVDVRSGRNYPGHFSAEKSATPSALPNYSTGDHQRDHLSTYKMGTIRVADGYPDTAPDTTVTLPAKMRVAGDAWNRHRGTTGASICEENLTTTAVECPANADGHIYTVQTIGMRGDMDNRECPNSYACVKGDGPGHLGTGKIIFEEPAWVPGRGLLGPRRYFWTDILADQDKKAGGRGLLSGRQRWASAERIATHELGHTLGLPDLDDVHHSGIMQSVKIFDSIHNEDLSFALQIYFDHTRNHPLD